jgi:hypothetical protein
VDQGIARSKSNIIDIYREKLFDLLSCFTHLLLNVHQRPHAPCYILQEGAEAVAAVGEVDPPFRDMARGWRGALRTLPANARHIPCKQEENGHHPKIQFKIRCFTKML